jgi:hypothetical protein
MTQPGDFVGHWRIRGWDPNATSSCPRVIKANTDLIITELEAGTFNLQWTDEAGKNCTLTPPLTKNGDGTLSVGSSTIHWPDHRSLQLVGATVEFMNVSYPWVMVKLTFGNGDEPQGGLPAPSPPRQIQYPSRWGSGVGSGLFSVGCGLSSVEIAMP